MGYGGKVAQQEQARLLRADGMILQDIAQQLGVSKSSVSLWVRDVDFVPRPHVRARRREPNVLRRRKQAEIDQLMADGVDRIGQLSEREFLVAGLALYAGEGSKRDVCIANTDPRIISFFCVWLRHFFAIDESRLRVRVYLHEGLDLDAATRYWSTVTAVPLEQFRTPYRARRTQLSVMPSTSEGWRTSATVAVGRTGASWVWCTRCSAARPFRGSSIGRAVAC